MTPEKRGGGDGRSCIFLIMLLWEHRQLLVRKEQMSFLGGGDIHPTLGRSYTSIRSHSFWNFEFEFIDNECIEK